MQPYISNVFLTFLKNPFKSSGILVYCSEDMESPHAADIKEELIL